ncbi:FixH family protein [Cohnella sp. AR92]|uniref:FixH family protein n=1 Tax=Cohnella sp. AR92 TaxID=648716 RepID=UPI000F8D2367|nr:FixH family protein [Cohnella sp. AR92]RUS46883.1 hypothetical protein ELR57_10760 [Cohnella sp. AR92]
MKRPIRRLAWPLSIAAILGIVFWLIGQQRTSALPLESALDTGSLRLEIVTLTAHSSPMEESHFLVRITDSNGLPVEADKLQIKTWMPKMFCGIFTAGIAPGGENGQYDAVVLPVMRGRWVAEANIQVGKETYKLQHEYVVR